MILFEKICILHMKRTTGYLVGDEIRFNMMGEGFVSAIVRCINNNSEVRRGGTAI